jgi:4-hydroxymandelate synthase
MSATKREQQPFVYGSLSKEEIYLKAPAATASPTAVVSTPPALDQTAAAPAEDERFWQAIKTSTVAGLYEEFLSRYPRSDHAAEARKRIEDFRSKQVAAVSPTTAVSPLSPPTRHGDLITATILGFGDVEHTFVQRAEGTDERALPGFHPVPVGTGPSRYSLGDVDHFAVCVPAGTVDATVEFYKNVLDFELIFVERIEVGSQAMTTKVVQSRSGSVTFTLIEPDVTRDPGHIDGFLTDHYGAGVQHIAFSTDNIVEAIGAVRDNGVEFLGTPDMYYRLLPERVELARYTVEELKEFSVLVDEDHDGQLYQIFTKSVHPRNTIFMELIERLGARSFGSGNIASLYEAVELERHRAEAAGAADAAAA